METFFVIARYNGEGHVLQFTMLSSWETVFDEVCKRWALDVSRVIGKFVMPDGYKTICPIESKADFQRMYHIYHMFNKNIADLIKEDVKGTSTV